MMPENGLVCSTTHVFHNFFNSEPALIQSVLENGLRPLSDFPESERWQQIEKEMPGFFAQLYEMIAAPIVKKPYENSGIFVSPIDFRLLPGSFLHDKPRAVIPISRMDPAVSALTYVLDGERISLRVNEQTLQRTSEIWTADMVNEWFARDHTKVFFFVPQLVTYQGQIEVGAEDFEGVDLDI
jgi:hypothetical protein